VLASAMSVLAGTAVFGGSDPHAGARSDESIGPVLSYRQPAKEWVEALPVGNGRLGGWSSAGYPPSGSS
jgi:alpha-L-fucosidase 2